MKFLEGLLGFAVLTGPLWLIVLLLIFGIWLAFKVAKRFTSPASKVAVGLGVVALVLVVPFADEIAGRIYLSHLCATEAGVKVYHAVELPAEYWDEEGKPSFRIFKSNVPGVMRLVGVTTPLFEERPFTERRSSLFHIDRAGFRLRQIESKEIASEVVYFRYWHGWIIRNFSPHLSATSCNLKDLDGWESNVFRPQTGK